MDKKIVITGGGSGGHVSAAQGIIDEIITRYPEAKKNNILYIGGKLVSESFSNSKSIEQTRFENSDIPFIAISGGKLQRSFSIKSIKLLLGFFGGFIDAWKILSRYQPDFVFSTGGYVSLPVCLVAAIKKIPIYIHEQTAAIGLTNKILKNFAKKIFITFPQSAKYLPAEKVIYSGNIIRKCIFKINDQNPVGDALKEMIPHKKNFPIIYISGGGQGSHFLNLNIRQMLKYLLLEYQIIHQIGDNGVNKDYEVMVAEKLKLPRNLQNRYFPTKYVNEEEIGNLFDKMDIYLGRSGANIVYEMGVIAKPSILIPIPWVTNNEQQKNAEILVDCGIGKIIPEGLVTAEQLYQQLKTYKIEFNQGKYTPDNDKLKKLFPINASETIVDLLLTQ